MFKNNSTQSRPEETPLDFIPEGRGQFAQTFNLVNVKRIRMLLSEGQSVKNIAQTMGLRAGGVKNILGELRRARDKGYTSVEQYMADNRPCAYHHLKPEPHSAA